MWSLAGLDQLDLDQFDQKSLARPKAVVAYAAA